MSIKSVLNKIKRDFQHEFFASKCSCVLCGMELTEECKYSICYSCNKRLVVIGENCCERCGRRLYGEERYCLSCKNNERYFDKSRAWLSYEGVIKHAIRRFKFHNARSKARYFAQIISDVYKSSGYNCDIMVTVPLSAARLKERGYNQVELIASELVMPRGVASGGKPYIDIAYCNAVAKVKDNARQTELDAAARNRNVEGVYEVVDKDAVGGKRVLLIDDIMTTGATCSEVARVLKRAGADSVECIVLAIAPYKIANSNDEEIEFNEEPDIIVI